MLRPCHACGGLSDDLYQINSWQICFGCVRTRRFWEMLRESWSAQSAYAARD